MRTKFPLLMLISLSVILLLNQTTMAQFASLVKHLPGQANTIILLNAEKVLDSALAKKEGWKENFEKAVEAGLVRLPADTMQYVLASQMDFQNMQPMWEVGVLKTRQPHSMSELADKRKGTTDTISGQEVVLLPQGNYVVQFESRIFGSLIPASRQATARWIRESDSDSQSLSEYMREAIGFSERVGTEIIIAMDLSDVIETDLAKERLKEFETDSGKDIQQEKVLPVITSIRGVTLGITLGEEPFGKIKLDFSQDASALEGVAASLFIAVLKRHNAMIDDFNKWTAKVDGQQITFQGYFSASGMRRVFSLIEAPVSEAVLASEQPAPKTGDQVTQEDIAYASQKYFRSLARLMDEFRNHESPQRIAQIGLWLDKYARKIDRLPMVNVDPEMLDFGNYVAQQYRNAASAIKGIGMRSRVRTVNVDNNTGYGYYGNNYYNGGYAYNGYYYRGGSGGYGTAAGYQNAAMNANLRSQQRAQTQIRSQEKTRGAMAARAIMQDVQNATQEVRRKMTEKYQIEF